MSRIYEMESDTTEEHIFPCNCHDWHYLRMRWDEDPEWRILWIEDAQEPRGWDRVRLAWRSLLGKSSCVSEIVLDEKSIDSLREALGQK